MGRKLSSFPIICTETFAKTVAFYEDMFDFVPVYETDTYVQLSHREFPDVSIGVMDSERHEGLPEKFRKPSTGMILALATNRFDELYNDVYYEGIEIIKEPGPSLSGKRSFMLADPNNNLIIDVMPAEEAQLANSEPVHTATQEKCRQECECTAA